MQKSLRQSFADPKKGRIGNSAHRFWKTYFDSTHFSQVQVLTFSVLTSQTLGTFLYPKNQEIILNL